MGCARFVSGACHRRCVDRNVRLSALVEELRRAGAGGCTAAELAERFAVTVRTVRRDVLTVRTEGVPVELAADSDDRYVLDEPPEGFVFSRVEAVAAAVAVALAEPTDPAIIAGSHAVLAKLHAALDPESRLRADLLVKQALLPLPDPSERREAVEDGLRQNLAVVLEYADEQGNTSRRLVDPMKFVRAKDRWYLVAWCLERDAMRSFRWDRVRAVHLSNRSTGPG